MRVGFLGTGNMGTPMGMRLIAAGHELSVWNRSEGRAKPLIHEGAIAAGTPAETELGADAVMTMLWDDEAYEQVVFGPNGLMDALSPGGLHISCSTISVGLSERLSGEYARRGVEFVGAPVFGSPAAAARGQVWVVAGGPVDAVNRARPLLEAFAQGVSVVGPTSRFAHAVKLGGSLLLGAMMQSMGEALAFAEQVGVAPEAFFNAINDALFASPRFPAYAEGMMHPPVADGTAMEAGTKDLRLLRAALSGRSTSPSLADRLMEIVASARRTVAS